MSRREFAFELVELADQLGLGGAADPVNAILRHCRTRIDRWLAEAGDVTTIGQLEALVTQRLQMVFEEIRSDADFDRIKEQYAKAKKDPVFASLRLEFNKSDNPIYGMLVRRRNVGNDAPDWFVAVIDCRGSKLARRFFTKWHEIAHRLTTHADQGATEPAYRSEHDPIERDHARDADADRRDAQSGPVVGLSGAPAPSAIAAPGRRFRRLPDRRPR